MKTSQPGALPCALAFVPMLLAAAPMARGAEVDCLIEARQLLELRSPTEGLIEHILVDRGDIVRRGQELVQLDARVDHSQAAIAQHRAQMEGALRSGEARVEFTTAKSRRQQELHEQNYVSGQGRDEALTENRLALAELRESQDNRRLAELEHARQMEIIRLKTIRSPIDGVVVERLLNPGELAEAGVGRKPMLKLAQIDVLHVEVVLRSQAWGKVALGSSVEVRPDVPAGTRYKATVKVIDRVLDAASGTFGVRLDLPNPQLRIPAGVRCKADFPQLDVAPAGRLPVPRTGALSPAVAGRSGG